jgi:rhomboid family GlyGly-CTERM serine protease
LKAAPAQPSIDASAPLPAGTASRAWLGLAAVLAGGSLMAASVDARWLDWQPDLALTQPWRWWSAAWVHWSQGHRWANVVGTLLVAALGWRAQCDRLDSLAWFIAWPLTHLGLLLQPALAHYGGLSGVLHAGVVIAALALLDRERGMRRVLGAAIVVAVLLKILLEHPWRGALQRTPGWDIAIAPAAHLSGAAMAVLCAIVVAIWRRRMGGAKVLTPSADQ